MTPVDALTKIAAHLNAAVGEFSTSSGAPFGVAIEIIREQPLHARMLLSGIVAQPETFDLILSGPIAELWGSEKGHRKLITDASAADVYWIESVLRRAAIESFRRGVISATPLE